MDHKDFMNDIISKMSQTNRIIEDVNDTENTVYDFGDVDISKYIKLHLSSGEDFLVNPDEVDWDAMFGNIESLEENVKSISNMMDGLLQVTDPYDGAENTEMIKTYIKQLTEFAQSLGITIDYKKVNTTLTDYGTVLFMCHDVQMMVMQFIQYAKLHNASQPQQTVAEDEEVEETDEDNNKDTVIEEMTVDDVYRVASALGIDPNQFAETSSINEDYPNRWYDSSWYDSVINDVDKFIHDTLSEDEIAFAQHVLDNEEKLSEDDKTRFNDINKKIIDNGYEKVLDESIQKNYFKSYESGLIGIDDHDVSGLLDENI